MIIKKLIVLAFAIMLTLVITSCNADENSTPPVNNDTSNVPADNFVPTDTFAPADSFVPGDTLSIVEKITAVERDASANAISIFDTRIISETLEDSGYGMNDDLGGCVLVFELENISDRAVSVDIAAVFPGEHGDSATLIEQNARFEPGQARQFTHSFGEYEFTDGLHLVIEYMNVRY